MKKYCSSSDHIPKTPHWAIVAFSSYFVPGDERSKSCPGHGYPDGYATSATYIAYDNESEWKNDIAAKLHPSYGSPDRNFVAMKVTPANISTEVTVKVS
jgi:hypothetical protein